MPSLLDLALGLLLPALVCGAILAAAHRGSERLRSAAGGVAFGLAWFLSYLAWAGWPAWPSVDRTPGARDWLAWIVLVAGTSSLLVLVDIPARILALLSRPVLSAALAGLMLRIPAVRSGSWRDPALAALAILLVWSAADRWIARQSGPRAPLALLFSATGTSLASLFVQDPLTASLAGALATCLGASTVLALVVPSFRLHSGASGVILLVLAGCLLNDLFFAKLPLASALLLAGSVLAPGLLDLRGRSAGGARGSWKGALLSAALALVPAALAAWIAWTPGEEAC